GYTDPPEGAATIDFGDEITVNYRGSWVHPGKMTRWAGEWRMEYERGEVWGTSRGDLHTEDDDEVWLYARDTTPKAPVLPTLARVDRAGALDAFVTALSEGVQPESSGKENLGSLVLAHAAVESAAKRAPITVRTMTRRL